MKCVLAVLLVGLLSGGCASTPAGGTVEHDPWEAANRKLFRFNEVVDNVSLKPVAKGYVKVVPEPVRKGVTNFSRNLATPVSVLNNFLQGKPRHGFQELARLFINSTVGIGGLFDIAAQSGVETHFEDFGQTAAVWGFPPGPFVMLPFLGPRTLRDVATLPLNLEADPLHHYDNSTVRVSLQMLRLVDVRARLLPLEELMKDSSDPYITMRESYLQNRNFQIYDGDPPTDDDEEFYDEFLDEEDY